ncbi:Phage major tail protein [Streptococcus oralis]|uniref:Phage major tail protein n=1 Tax=Streptococcus oralis TaxID=1303 RepID=A0A139RIK9_STROR|nr:major tail protein [Streptococcus oralis]KXU14597.1 Phage major tail protein [Streptococcus oralis]
MALVGFKRMTIRILDGAATPTLGTNLFVIEGQANKGATRTAKISGLASDPVKTYGSNIAYHVSSRGVGDVKMETTAVDIPIEVITKILGHQVTDDIIGIGANTQAPYCSVMLESATPAGVMASIGFFKGQFSMDAEELETLKDKQEELPDDSLSFAAVASDDKVTEDLYVIKYFGKDEEKLKKFKGQLKMVTAG